MRLLLCVQVQKESRSQVASTSALCFARSSTKRAQPNVVTTQRHKRDSIFFIIVVDIGLGTIFVTLSTILRIAKIPFGHSIATIVSVDTLRYIKVMYFFYPGNAF